MTEKTDPNELNLEALFTEAQEQTPDLTGDLRARILADAARLQAVKEMHAPYVTRPGLVSQLLKSVGGWSGLGGLAMAAVAGLWIGFANPTLVSPDVSDIDVAEVSDDDLFGDILLGDSLFFEEG